MHSPSRPRTTLGLALAALALCTGLVSAQEPAHIAMESYELENGLQVILAPDHSAQVVAVNVWYRVGSRDEVPGRTGFAHLFEHMMFQGSANVEKAQHFQFVERAGGNLNGSTAEDRTNYFEVLPSNRLNLGLWLEADRMRSLEITEENFSNQREAVKEERRLRVDNQPYTGALFEGVYAITDSTSCFPYAHSVIGSMDDLNAAETPDVQAFFDQYYVPNNATLTLTGDFDPAETKALINQYFGDIPRGAEPPPVVCDQAFNTGTIRNVWPDDKANLPGVVVAFRIPAYADPDTPALELLGTILGQGESSRMNQSVVRDQKLAQFSLTAANLFGSRRGPGLVLTLAVANQNVSIDSLEAAILDEFVKVRENGVTEAELSKAQNLYRTGLITQQQRALVRAEAIQSANLFLGDPQAVNTHWKRYTAVTVDDIKRIAQQYLRVDNALILLITPEPAK